MASEMMIPFLAVFAGAGLAFFAIWYFVTSLLRQQRQHLEHRLGADDNEPPLLLERSASSRGANDWTTRVDTGFDQMVARSGLELTTNMALGIILFCGVTLGAFVFIWRYETEAWMAIPSFFIG